MESVKMKEKIMNKKIDRSVLDPETMIALKGIFNQAETELGDVININTKKIINFLLRYRNFQLSKDELSMFKIDNHDIVKALKKATQEAIRSRKSGLKVDYSDIQKIIQTPSVNEKIDVTKPQQKKKKTDKPVLIDNTSNSLPDKDKKESE